MKVARKIDRGVMITAVVLLALPAFARANPLLSGYGAPGQGSQALLGSTLTGPRGGGGGGGGAGSAQSIEQAPPTPTGQSGVAGQSIPEAHTHATTSRPGSSRTGAASAGNGGGAPASGPAVPPKVALQPTSSVHTDAAGLSGGDIALIVLAIGVIFATGLLTTRIARGGKSVGGGG